MHTKLDPDDDLEIPEFDFTNAIRPGRIDCKSGGKTEICLEGTVEYQLRLLPSTKVIGRFISTLDAWPAIIAAARSGRSPRTLSLDAIGRGGERWHMAAGPFLVRSAELNNGGPHPNGTWPDEDDRPDTSLLDWSKAVIGRRARKPGEKTEVFIDGAVGYALRLIPSNKVLARFESTLDAWPVIIATVEGGRSPRTLSLDWVAADGFTGSISAGPRLERWARHSNGEPYPYADTFTSLPPDSEERTA